MRVDDMLDKGEPQSPIEMALENGSLIDICDNEFGWEMATHLLLSSTVFNAIMPSEYDMRLGVSPQARIIDLVVELSKDSFVYTFTTHDDEEPYQEHERRVPFKYISTAGYNIITMASESLA